MSESAYFSDNLLLTDNSIEMDMNNRKSETRTELKGFDITIEVCFECHRPGDS